MYFSGSTRQFFTRPDLFGVMFNTAARTGLQYEALESGSKFMVDNGVFSGLWAEEKWRDGLKKFLPYSHNCKAVIIPDAIGDWRETLARFELYYAEVKALGLPVAYATQDGQPLDLVPWDRIDVLFIGGSNYHKRGKEAELLALEAKRRGIWVHVGRVSSIFAARKYWPWADSYDGTTFRFEPDKKEEKLIPQMEIFFNETNRAHQFKLL